ncbi:MAG: DUF6378 domain-containing protein [Acinetobacter sp.]
MEKLKIVINGNEDIAKEAKELFKELGYYISSENRNNFYGWSLGGNQGDYYINKTYFNSDAARLVTIEELRAIVYLHKNPINMDKVLNEVRSDALGLLEDKEYLRKNSNGTYSYVGTVHPDHVHDLLIEIPEGAESFNYFNSKGNVFFLKNDGDETLFSNETEDWAWQDWGSIDFDGVICLWQRHTHPEELPFVDDESINDQYAEIEQVRQSSIADTLNERQSTYGDFKDVANTTQYLLQMLSTDAMSDVQLEALHMICSKLARIAHGDPNYKDNWHDIAGYATLVERSL